MKKKKLLKELKRVRDELHYEFSDLPDGLMLKEQRRCAYIRFNLKVTPLIEACEHG